MGNDAIMTYGTAQLGEVDMHMGVPSPGSPPGMSSSKSSKTSSLRSFGSDDDNSVLADAGHFEEIGLDDDTITIDTAHSRDTNQAKSNPNPYASSFTADLRAQSTKHVGPKIHPQTSIRPALHHQQRDITATSKSMPRMASLSGQFRDTSTHNLTTIGPQMHARPPPTRGLGLTVRSASTLSYDRRRRSPSPNHSLRSVSPRDPNAAVHPRRRSWQATSRDRKSTVDLEKECDDDDDNIPDNLILDNVPISPRPPVERAASRPASTNTSPDRLSDKALGRVPKERVRSVGNGTPPIAQAQGSLRSPSWRSDVSSAESVASISTCTSPIKGRAKSWTAVLSDLSAEAKALTEKLEEHADEQDKHGLNTMSRPGPKPRVKSALAELPPLRRTNIMIDPLPISKEKEKVLSRTRPSWLPPKDPAEEKKHIRQYQKMIANSIDADKRREAARLNREKGKDAQASNLMRVWEEDILLRWEDAVRERRTRELWWKGIAPRSRGAVWTRAIGNELGLSETGYLAALARAREVEARVSEGKATIEDERKAAWFKQIRADIEERTWTDLKIFQSEAPLHQGLVDVLSAYAMYRSDIGYVAGCNTIAAILLLNLPSPTATFIALANVLNRSLPLSFHASDHGAKASAYNLLLQNLQVKSPRLHEHLMASDYASEDGLLLPDEYLADVFTSLFTKHLGLDECTRLWDVYVFEGDAVLVRAAVALLVSREGELMGAKNAEQVRRALMDASKSDLEGKVDEWMRRVRDAGKV